MRSNGGALHVWIVFTPFGGLDKAGAIALAHRMATAWGQAEWPGCVISGLGGHISEDEMETLWRVIVADAQNIGAAQKSWAEFVGHRQSQVRVDPKRPDALGVAGDLSGKKFPIRTTAGAF